jgi:PST family polysaccharide transporter
MRSSKYEFVGDDIDYPTSCIEDRRLSQLMSGMADRLAGDLEPDRFNSRALDTDHLLTGLGIRSANGVALSVLGQCVSIVLQTLNAALMARLLTPDDFGVAALATSVTGLVGLFTDLGLSVASVQMRELDQNTASALFAVNILAGLIGMMLCFSFAMPAAWVFHDRRVFWAILAFGCIVPAAAAAVQHNAVLVRGMRWWSVQSIGIASLVAGVLVGAVAAAVLNAGFWALIAASAATALTRLVLLWIACPWRPSRVREWASARSAVNFGAYMTGFNLTNFLARQVDIVLIGWLWGAAETGLYSRAYQLMLLPMNAISGPLGGIFVPALSRLQSDPARWRDAFMRVYLVSAIAGCAFASVFIVSAEHIINLVYGPNWQDTIAIFRWLSWSMISTFPMGAMAWAFVSLGNSKAMFHWGLLSFVVLAVVFALALPYGALGMAKAFTIAIWGMTPACFHLALGKSPVSTGKALIEIAPLWIAAFAAAGTGLSAKSVISFSLLPSLIVESAVTAATFFLVAVLLAHRRSEYRRLAATAWALAAAAAAQRRAISN